MVEYNDGYDAGYDEGYDAGRQAAEFDNLRLHDAALVLYRAGLWQLTNGSPHDHAAQGRMWEALRDALLLPPRTSTP